MIKFKNDAVARTYLVKPYGRGYTQHEVLRVRAVALRRAPSALQASTIKIWPGQTAVRARRLQDAHGRYSASGPWNDVYSGTVTVPSCADAGICSHMYTCDLAWQFDLRSPYWRLFVLNSVGGASTYKEVEFSVCS